MTVFQWNDCEGLAAHVEDLGFAVVESVLEAAAVEQLQEHFRCWAADQGVTCGTRRVLEKFPVLADILEERQIFTELRRKLGLMGPWSLSRVIYFDKTERNNWKATWHQDVTIAVAERHELEDFGPWSVKAGIAHCQAPVNVLEKIWTLRLHLDDCDDTNGALRVLPGSHKLGRLSAEAVRAWCKDDSQMIAVPAGGALLMKPLIFHSSGKVSTLGHRRVLHFEFANTDLPKPLKWQTRRRG